MSKTGRFALHGVKLVTSLRQKLCSVRFALFSAPSPLSMVARHQTQVAPRLAGVPRRIGHHADRGCSVTVGVREFHHMEGTSTLADRPCPQPGPKHHCNLLCSQGEWFRHIVATVGHQFIGTEMFRFLSLQLHASDAKLSPKTRFLFLNVPQQNGHTARLL